MTPEQAKELCILAHKGQFRRDGITPYSTHPIAVAEMMNTDEEKIVAYLHDVIEDTDYNEQQIMEKLYNNIDTYKHIYYQNIFFAITTLTKSSLIDYKNYIELISFNKLATKVKLADMFHNMSCNPSNKQKAKYLQAIPILLKTL